MASENIDVYFKGNNSNLSAAAGKAKADIDRVAKAAKDQKAAMKENAAAVKGFIGAYLGVSAAANIYRSALEKFGNIQDISDRTGLTPEFLQGISKFAEKAGTSVDAVAKGVTKFAKQLVEGGEASSKSLEMINMTLSDFDGLNPQEIFAKAAAGISAIEDPTKRAAAAQAIFSKGGAELIPILENVSDALNDTSVLSKEQVQNIDDLGDAWEGFKNQVTAGAGAIVSALKPMFDWIGKAADTVAANLGILAGQVGIIAEGGSLSDAAAVGKLARNSVNDGIWNPDAPSQASPGAAGFDASDAIERGTKDSKDKPRLDELPSEKAYRLAKEGGDPTNPTYKNGSVRRPGELRALQRKADRDRAAEDRRIARGLGGPSRVSQQGDTGAAEKLAQASMGARTDLSTHSMSAAERANQSGFWKSKADQSKGGKKTWQEELASQIGDGSKGAAGAGDQANDPLASIAADVKTLKQDVHERLPKKSTGKG